MSSDRLTLAEHDQLLVEAAQRARRYIQELADRPVAPAPESVADLTALDTALPQHSVDPQTVLAQLDEIGSPATMASAGPRYFGFVTGGTHPSGLAAAWLASAWDQNAALSAMSPVAATLDGVAVRWIADLLGLPAGCGGGFVTGATMANTTALACARDRVLAEAGWDVYAQGLVGAPPIKVYVGAEAHTTIAKALGLVGLGRDRAEVLPVDDQGRIRATDLPSLEARPTIVCLQAGNVNTGASDPFVPLIEWARTTSQPCWVHIDGAFGLWAAAAPERRHLVAGSEGADSWATDAHKWLNVGYDSGVVLVRDPAHLQASMGATASYLPNVAGQRQPMQYTPQSSQRARGVEAWAVLATLGREGVAQLVEGCCQLATRMAGRLTEAGIEVVNDVELNQVLVRLGADPEAAVDRLQTGGVCWAGTSERDGELVLRVSVSNWSTTSEDIDVAAESIVAAIRA